MLETIVTGVAVVFGTVVLIFFSYFAMRWVTGGEPEERTRELAGSVIFRVSALHGLILALVFANETIEYQQLRHEGAIEATALADIYFDISRYGAETKPEVQAALFDYLQLASGEEWRALGETGRLSQSAWEKWDIAYNRVLDLNPATPREESLRANMLDRIHTVAESRNKRGNHASTSVNGMFWFAAISGVVLIALAYYSYPPKRFNLLLIGMFGAFTGIVLFFIYAFSNPFSQPGALQPVAHERLIEQLLASGAGGGRGT